MTSASELFYHRRYRSDGRNLNSDLSRGPDHYIPSDSFRRHHGPPRRHHHRRTFHTETESFVANNSSPQSSATSNSNSGRVNRLIGIGNDRSSSRLPEAVLQARARLLERLQGVTPMGSRLDTRISSTSPGDFEFHDDFEVIETLHQEAGTDRELPEPNTQRIHVAARSKPPGLTQDAFFSVPQEVFKNKEEMDRATGASLECCICLERFEDGERLSRLPCKHKFHPACLEPWLRTCGDCPYCRACL